MTLEIPIHKSLLIEILKDIYTDMEIGPFLGFKGGTAALLFHDLPRFSVDLDFDLLDETKVDFIFQRIEKTLKAYGVLKNTEKKRFDLFYLLSYTHKTPGAYNIKVEINCCTFGSQYEVRSYLGVSIKTMIKPDIVAHKMVAMLERAGKANRDIFDVNFFLKNHWPINTAIIERRTGLTMPQFLRKCIATLEAFDRKTILACLGELLNEKQKVWVKQHLIEDTIFLLRLKLENETQ